MNESEKGHFYPLSRITFQTKALQKLKYTDKRIQRKFRLVSAVKKISCKGDSFDYSE